MRRHLAVLCTGAAGRQHCRRGSDDRHAFDAALRANPRRVAVNTDMAIAFGTVDLTCMLQDVADEAPLLLQYTGFKNNQPTRPRLAKSIQ